MSEVKTYHIETFESLKGTSMWPQVFETAMTGTIPVVPKDAYDQLKKECDALSLRHKDLHKHLLQQTVPEMDELTSKLDIAIQALEKCKIVCEQQNFDTESGMLGEAFKNLAQLRGEK